jgi:hypothetical protein
MTTMPLRIAALGLLTVAGIGFDAPAWAVSVTGVACVALPAARALPATRALLVKPTRPGRQRTETQEENHAWTR